jgi:FkbM family methyltransferase
MNIYDKSNLKYNHNIINPIIVDLGANVGVEAAKLFSVYPQSNIILVEPQEENCERIFEYIKKNNLENYWLLNKCAIDTSSGLKNFGFHNMTPDGRLNGSLDEFNWKEWNYEGVKPVQTKSFDDICLTPNIIKIDIERHEYIVLPDICKNINIQIMYIEMHGPCYELNVVNFLNECLKNNGLEVTGWYSVTQLQSYADDDSYIKVEPQNNINCGNAYTVIIERI